MCKILTIVSLIFITAAGFTSDCRAKPKHQFKIASLAPEGSVWVNVFKDLPLRWRKKRRSDRFSSLSWRSYGR